MNKRKRRLVGFTLVEVSLFLAVTAVLFVGIITATQGSIWQQRFYDSVQSYAEFWRGIYSQVSNPQTVGQGNTETAIYGKLVVFGESVDLQGNSVNATTDANYGQQIFIYDVVGDATGTGTGSVVEMLSGLNANVIMKVLDSRGNTEWIPAGEVTDYVPRWGAEIETTTQAEPFTGSILVVRHPQSGTINTLVSKEVIHVNGALQSYNGSTGVMERLLKSKLDSFEPSEIDFCLNPYGYGVATDNRRDIRLAKNARNSSGVQIIDLDSDENRCR